MKRSALLLVIIGVIMSSQCFGKVTVERLNYRGWDDSYRLTAGPYSLVVVPDIGARIMEYSIDGDNVIWENPEEFGKTYPMTEEWHNYGGYKTWLAPQSSWGGWPDPLLDYGKANVEVLKDPKGLPTLKITGAPGLDTGVVFSKEITMTESGEVRLTQRMHNISGRAISFGVWDVTQVDTPCFVVFPIKDDSDFEGGVSFLHPDSKTSAQFYTLDGLSVTRYMGEVGKIGSDSDGPWMIWFQDDLAYVKLFEPMIDGVEYPDGGCSAEVFTSDRKLGYLEMEILGPLVDLQPGETTELTEQWRIFRLTQPVTDNNRILKAVEGMKGKGWIPENVE